MQRALLASKLHIPRPWRELVHRPRLMERLDAGLQGKLTLVSAPAGYGKTTLVADWVGHARLPTAWLSLDAADNDLARFLTYLIAALQRIDESIGIDVLAALREDQAPHAETLLTRLVIDIATAADGNRRAIVLILDDSHLVSAEPVYQALDFLLEHLPAAMHVLIAGRRDPPLPISRLRVQGEITEIRTPQLRFTGEEAAALLNDLMDLGISAADIVALEARTEGWIASLQLAALSLRDRTDKHEFVAAFSGSHRYIIDYLMDEVLSRQPAHVQSFLHRTSILGRLCAGLCDAVCIDLPSRTGESVAPELRSSQKILRQLEKDNLFLIPLDDERDWYRYHHLFASFLEQRLRASEPHRIPELHRRASEWYEGEGLVDDAIRHALMANDLDRATRLVDQIAASLVVRRENNKLKHLVEQLPRDPCQDYPMLCLWHAWALLFLGQLNRVEPLLQIAEANKGKAPQFPIHAYAMTVRAYVSNHIGDLRGAIDLCEQALADMPVAPSDHLTPIYRGAAVIWLGVNHRYLGNLDRARQLFTEAAPLNLQAGSISAALAAMEQLGDLAMIDGRLHESKAIYRRGLRMAQGWTDREMQGRGMLLAATGLYLGLGTVLYQQNDLTNAAPHIERAVELNELGEDWSRFHSIRMLAYLRRAEGDDQAAYDLAGKACAIRDAATVRQFNLSAQPSLEQLRILLGRSRPKMAYLLTDVARRIEALGLWPDDAALADRVDFAAPSGYVREPEHSDLARALIALGQPEEALQLLERLLEAAQSMGRQGDAIRYLALRALAYDAKGSTGPALASLRQALTLAEPEGYVRLFADEGQPMAALLARALAHGIAPEYINELLAVFPDGVRQAAERVAATLPPRQPLAEPLSERELEVLRPMARGLKYREVAEQLYVSLNTIRHHTKNIYGKLNVNTRAQAVDIAERLNLL